MGNLPQSLNRVVLPIVKKYVSESWKELEKSEKSWNYIQEDLKYKDYITIFLLYHEPESKKVKQAEMRSESK